MSHGKGRGKQHVALGAWTIPEQIDEMRGKIHLKERDGKACFERSEADQSLNEELIADLRVENKQKRIVVAHCVNGDEKVIRSVFHHRREELLSMQRFTVEGAIKCMDQKMCEAGKRLSALQFQREQREQRLSELNSTLEKMVLLDSTDFGVDRDREIRKLQNDLDKARIKHDAARNISRRYEEIMSHMQEVDDLASDCRLYPAKLDGLEQILEEATSELKELTQMKEIAVHSSELSRKNLHAMEKEMYQARRSRDQQLNETKKEVEKRREPTERVEKKVRVPVLSEQSDTKAARMQMLKADRQEKILRLEDAFEKIKTAINVCDIDDIVFRVANQDDTRERLKHQEKEKLGQRARLKEELIKLKQIFNELKFTSQKRIQAGRRIVEDMNQNTLEQVKRLELTHEKLEKNEHLLLDLQNGIATLFDKLKVVKLKPPYHNYSKGDPADDLMNCGRKLDVLTSALGMKDETPAPLKLDSQKFNEYLEGRLPNENTRVRFEYEDLSDSDEFHFDHDQDNDGLLTRDDVKRLGQDILDSKFKPKKKKARKSRAT